LEVGKVKANECQYPNVPAEKFEFVQHDQKIYDEKFDTKPIGYFKDAWIRFKRNKGSVVAGIVLSILILFALFGPSISKFDMQFDDMFLKDALPKSKFFSKLGFWDGNKEVDMNIKFYNHYINTIPETGYIVKDLGEFTKTEASGKVSTYHRVVVDSYKAQGFIYELVSGAELQALRDYQKETGIQMIYPMLDDYLGGDSNNNNYLYDENNLYVYSVLRNENPDPSLNQYQIRILYYEYFVYENGFEPYFLFGSNSHGQDIFVRLGTGARLSLLLGLSVAIINILIGIAYGAIEGYYGGVPDLVMQRFVEILSALPFIVLVTLFQLHFADKLGVVLTLLFAFVFTGWIGTSDTVRSQFYRYKGQEYVLAARTLGARDRRIIARHILPNAIGPVITSTVLIIPSVIFSESMLSYLGIVDLSTSKLTSIGSMLADGENSMMTLPHIIFFPALFISILMISFNIFGNGLRDAFNPSLRGVE
jgi:oligopeptide transport system permease protein